MHYKVVTIYCIKSVLWSHACESSIKVRCLHSQHLVATGGSRSLLVTTLRLPGTHPSKRTNDSVNSSGVELFSLCLFLWLDYSVILSTLHHQVCQCKLTTSRKPRTVSTKALRQTQVFTRLQQSVIFGIDKWH